MGEQDPNDVPKQSSKPLARTLDKTVETSAGIPLDEVYDEASLSGRTPPFDPARDLGRPGEFPFTRGVHASMYRGKLWTMRQYAGFGTAAESNRRYKFLLASGQTGLSVAFDLPTQMGRDADHPLARGEVGRAGVSISSLDDMQALLDGLPLDTVSTSMTINATAATLLCLYVAVADERGVARDKLSGTIQNDILKEYIARGTYIYPPAASMRLCADSFAWCARELPRWNTVSISGYHIREAGSDAVQEVAFTLADGIAYVEAARSAGLPVDVFAPRLSFFFNAHAHLLEEVAKFRAARRLWARIMRDRLDADGGRSAQQRRPHHHRGAGRPAGGGAVDPHQRLRRGAGSTDGDLGAGGAADPADPGARKRCRRRGRSTGRRLRDRVAHLGDRGARGVVTGGDRPTRRHGRRDRGRLPSAGDRGAGPRPPARGRDRRARDRRRQPLQRRRARGRPAAPPHRPDPRGGSDGLAGTVAQHA